MIIDEAHYNSFTKLFKYFENSFILGVTATPLSSNRDTPMNDNYQELIVGESIQSLIDNEFLARAEVFQYNMGLTALEVGSNGDYTVIEITLTAKKPLFSTMVLILLSKYIITSRKKAYR